MKLGENTWYDYQNTLELGEDVLLDRRLQVRSLEKKTKNYQDWFPLGRKHSFMYDRRDGRELNVTKNLVKECKENDCYAEPARETEK